jgi:hypothetical protein
MLAGAVQASSTIGPVVLSQKSITTLPGSVDVVNLTSYVTLVVLGLASLIAIERLVNTAADALPITKLGTATLTSMNSAAER